MTALTVSPRILRIKSLLKMRSLEPDSNWGYQMPILESVTSSFDESYIRSPEGKIYIIDSDMKLLRSETEMT